MPATYVVETVGTNGLTLKSLNTYYIYNGTYARVLELNDDFVLDKTSSADPDDINVIAPINGPGRWIRRFGTNLSGNLVSSQDPTDGQVLTWSEADGLWKPQSPGDFAIGGDISGTTSGATVTKIQGFPIASDAPTDGYSLTWSSGAWRPTSTALSGDLQGNSSNASVIRIQGKEIANTNPLDGYVLTWIDADSKWEPKPTAKGPALKTLDFPFLSSVTAINETTFQTIGSLDFDRSKLSPSTVDGTRTIKLKLVLQTTGTTAEIILYNMTEGTTVNLTPTSIQMTTNATYPYLSVSQDLTSFLTNGPAQYEVRIRQISKNNIQDQAICSMCTLEVEWTF